MSFKDKVVIVTGASSGVGRGIAEHFSKLSAKLVLVGRKADNLNTVAEICRNNSGLRPVTVIADVVIEEDLKRIISETKKNYGKLDVLINNAGALKTDNGFSNTCMETFDEMIKINLRSVVQLTSLALPLLIETQGSIVNTSSVTTMKVLPKCMFYAIAKAGMNTYSKYLAAELVDKKVNVNCIILGYVRSEIFVRAGENREESDSFCLSKVPARVPIEAENVGALAAFLSSDCSKMITGSLYTIDGGYLL